MGYLETLKKKFSFGEMRVPITFVECSIKLEDMNEIYKFINNNYWLRKLTSINFGNIWLIIRWIRFTIVFSDLELSTSFWTHRNQSWNCHPSQSLISVSLLFLSSIPIAALSLLPTLPHLWTHYHPCLTFRMHFWHVCYQHKYLL